MATLGSLLIALGLCTDSDYHTPRTSQWPVRAITEGTLPRLAYTVPFAVGPDQRAYTEQTAKWCFLAFPWLLLGFNHVVAMVGPLGFAGFR